MPTYEYRCPNGHRFDLFQRMTEEPRADCPECGAASERILSGGAGFLFKGEGFYITDSRSEAYRKAASKEKEGGTASPTKEKEGSPKAGGGAPSSSKPSSNDSPSKPGD